MQNMKEACIKLFRMSTQDKNQILLISLGSEELPLQKRKRVKGPFEIMCFNPLVIQMKKPRFLGSYAEDSTS